MCLGDGADALLHQHELVGRRHRMGGRRRELQLAGGVLGMDLVDLDSLSGQRRQEVGQIGRQLDDPGHAAPRSEAGGRGAVTVSPPDEPLHLERHPEAEAGIGGPGGHGPGEAALVAGVTLAFLGPAVRRCPRPPGHGVQRRNPLQVREQPQVAHGAADVGAGGDGVVDTEHVEHRRHPDAVGGSRFQTVDGHRLHTGHAGVVDRRQRHRPDAGSGQRPHELLRPCLRLPVRVNAAISVVATPGVHQSNGQDVVATAPSVAAEPAGGAVSGSDSSQTVGTTKAATRSATYGLWRSPWPTGHDGHS